LEAKDATVNDRCALIETEKARHSIVFMCSMLNVSRSSCYAWRDHVESMATLRRYPLPIVDEVGYIPFETEAANLFFQLVSRRREHASLILSSNLPFSGWAKFLGITLSPQP